MSDRTPHADTIRNRRHRLQKFVGVLKTPTGILLEEYLKENNNRLRHLVELSNRQWCMQMPVHQLGGSASKWRLPSQHLPKRRAQRIQIGTNIHADSGKLLRAGEAWCTSKGSRDGNGCFRMGFVDRLG